MKGENMSQELASKLMKVTSGKGITTDDIKSVVQSELKTIIEHLNKLTLIVSQIDNKVSKLSIPQATIPTTTNKQKLEVAETTNDKFIITDKVKELISDIDKFQAVVNKVYHGQISFEAFKSNIYSSLKDMGIDSRRVIPGTKSKEIWSLIESSWKKPVLKDVTPRVTLAQELTDNGVSLKNIESVCSQFQGAIESGMFNADGSLIHECWKIVSNELDINFSKLPANMESKVRLYVSTTLRNNMNKKG
jgi:hypothetical protein